MRSTAITALFLFTLAASASAQEREIVTFEVVHTPSSAARDVYLLGDLPELGRDDLTRSVKLVSSDRSTWRVTVSLPTNRSFTYHYYDRFRVLAADPTNGIPFGDTITDHTDSVLLRPSGKIVYVHSSIAAPVLHWRQDDGSFTALPMRDVGPGRGAGERRWEAGPFGEARRPVEFFVSSTDESQRDPADDAIYQTPLDAALLQDGELFDYVPANQVSAPRWDYQIRADGISTVLFHSSLIDYDYDVRVLLPRGYDEHLFRHYSVIFSFDGESIWDGYFSPTVDPGASISSELTQRGAMREVIQVGVDNSEVLAAECTGAAIRLRDSTPPDDTFDVGAIYGSLGCAGTGTGQADRYAAFLRDELKPWIDAHYRTLPDREHTGFTGYSAGGIVAFYLGWDFPNTFGRVGAQSFALGTNFLARVRAEPKRSSRVYVDAGGPVLDSYGYQGSLPVRDALVAKAPEPYVLERDLHYFVGGLDQTHGNPFGSRRWPEMLPFLFPATEEPPACYDGIDNDGDGAIDYAPGAGGDVECASALDPSEQRNDCSDGIDNDGDSFADYPDDPGCPFSYATIENPECDDGIDNDGNGITDFADSKCQPSWPYWEKPPACGLGAELALLLPLVGYARGSRRLHATPVNPTSALASDAGALGSGT